MIKLRTCWNIPHHFETVLNPSEIVFSDIWWFDFNNFFTMEIVNTLTLTNMSMYIINQYLKNHNQINHRSTSSPPSSYLMMNNTCWKLWDKSPCLALDRMNWGRLNKYCQCHCYCQCYYCHHNHCYCHHHHYYHCYWNHHVHIIHALKHHTINHHHNCDFCTHPFLAVKLNQRIMLHPPTCPRHTTEKNHSKYIIVADLSLDLS